MTEEKIQKLPDSNISVEEMLGPPKVLFVSVIMAVIGSSIAGFVSSAMIFIMLYIFLGNFALDTGASPVLLSMITFFALTAGCLITYFISSLVFPEMYTRSVTAMSQVTAFSIFIYIFFAPIYLLVSNSQGQTSLLDIFSLHVILSVFGYYIIVSVISHYRYVLLAIYASFIGLLFTGAIWVFVILPLDASSQALSILILLVILAFVGTTFLVYMTYWLYYRYYISTGSDFVGNIFLRIEKDEKGMENDAAKVLTKFE